MKKTPGFLLFAFFIYANCNKNDPGTGSGTPIPSPGNSDASCWLTTGDKSSLLEKQSTILNFGTLPNSHPVITVDSTSTYQNIDGFGYTLTQASAWLINHMGAVEKSNLLNELFGSGENSVGISFLRIGIGATDLSTSVYSYNDLPPGQTDLPLAHFSLDPDRADLIPLLKAIIAIRPQVKILATPWSAPVWMKDNGNSKGGSLQLQYQDVYARYFVKYIQAMQAEGVIIYAITPQNEPLHPGNNPSMYMTSADQAGFIKNHLGPAFAASSISTKIIVYDHNCDRPDYPLEILNDAAARTFVNGTAFHLYAGDISVLSKVHNLYPDKDIYFTEQYTGSNGNFADDLKWHMKNVIIGSLLNWSKVALEWNMANDPTYGPYTPGGCTTCLGAITIGNGTLTRNVSYYIIAQVSRFVPAGSVRIASDNYGSLQTVAFLRPDGKKVLLVLNEGNAAMSFAVKFNEKWFTTSLGGAVATYVW